MKRNFSFAKLVFVLALIASVIGFTAFGQVPGSTKSFPQEATPDRDSSGTVQSPYNEPYNRFDQLDIQLKQLDAKLDQLNVELRNVDLNKIQLEVDKAMKELDNNKISAEVDKSIKNIDWNKINKEVNKSVARLGKVRMIELKTKMEKLKTQVEKQKFNHHFLAPKIDTKKIRIQTEKAMKGARKSIENAKAEMRNIRDLTNALLADGLIDTSKPYRIEGRSGELYINGIKQSKEVQEKYKRYLRKENFSIGAKGEDDDWI